MDGQSCWVGSVAESVDFFCLEYVDVSQGFMYLENVISELLSEFSLLKFGK